MPLDTRKVNLRSSLTCQCAVCWRRFPPEQSIMQITPTSAVWMCIGCTDKLQYHREAGNAGAWLLLVARIVKWRAGEVAP